MIPASIRNKNPGAQYPGPSARKFGGAEHETLRSKDGVHKIATFPTHIHGAAAQFDLLHAKYCGMTVKAAVTKWCGGFYASTYLKMLKEKAGVSHDTKLTREMVKDPAIAIPLARAMAWQEAGQDYPMDDEEWAQAHALAFAGSAVAPSFAPDNDVPSPKPETRQAEAMKTVAAVTVPVAGGVALIPGVPTAVADTATNAEAWQGVATQVTGLLGWLSSNPGKAGLALAIVAGIGWGLPAIAKWRAA